MSTGNIVARGPTASLIKPQFNSNDLLAQFKSYSRQPFIEVMAYMFQCVPDEKQLQEFANEHPDKWASAVKVFAQLSGYHDKLEVSGNIAVEVSHMGDAQLMAKLDEVKASLEKMSQGEELVTIESSIVEDAIVIEDQD